MDGTVAGLSESLSFAFRGWAWIGADYPLPAPVGGLAVARARVFLGMRADYLRGDEEQNKL